MNRKIFLVFEKWLNTYVSNWVECDTLCSHTLGIFIEKYPKYIENLKKWAQSQNKWTKRGAAVTLILPAGKGMFFDDFFEITKEGKKMSRVAGVAFFGMNTDYSATGSAFPFFLFIFEKFFHTVCFDKFEILNYT